MSRKFRRTRSRSATREPSFLLTDPNSFDRSNRLEHLLLDELQSLISDEATDPALEGIRLLAVHPAPDGGHARVAYAAIAELSVEQELAESTKAGLVRATPFLRARLAEQLQLKKLPKLTFTFVGVTCPE